MWPILNRNRQLPVKLSPPLGSGHHTKIINIFLRNYRFQRFCENYKNVKTGWVRIRRKCHRTLYPLTEARLTAMTSFGKLVNIKWHIQCVWRNDSDSDSDSSTPFRFRFRLQSSWLRFRLRFRLQHYFYERFRLRFNSDSSTPYILIMTPELYKFWFKYQPRCIQNV